MNDAEINRILRKKYNQDGVRKFGGRPPRFTQEEARRLIELRQSGRSIESLAREHRTSQRIIAKYVREGFQPVRWQA